MHPHAARPVPAPPAALRAGFTALVALAEVAHLLWEHLHGGIVRHHLFNDPAMPAIWNGWGLVVLPVLAWIASGRTFERSGHAWRPGRAFVGRLLAGIAAGLALSTAFTTGREDVAGYVLIGLLLTAAAVRIYRIECLLGLVLAMTFTFGAILPTLIGGCIALLSAIVWKLVYPIAGRAASTVRRLAHR